MTFGATSVALDGDVVARVLAATLLAGLVGFEREASDQPAGLRTHMAVGLGAAVFGIISTLGFEEFDQRRANTVLQADVTRVASQVVVGIGFLGAGVIFRQGSSIRNLTTAASLWTVAAIGLACGVGDLATGAIATVILLVSLVLLRPLRSLIRKYMGEEYTELRIDVASPAATGRVIEAVSDVPGVEVTRVEIHKAEDRTILTLGVRSKGDTASRVDAVLADLPDVEALTHD